MNGNQETVSNDAEICPDCGNPVPVDSPLGMCPTCLIGSLSENEDEPAFGPTDDSNFEKIADYQIVKVIGEGGFAIVYEASQSKPIRRSVALKILRKDIVSPQVLARFEAEQQALAMMDHPNIAAVYDAGETDTGIPFVAIELIDGIPITDFVKEQNLTLTQKLVILKNICEAVQHAHLKGIIHRDLKPSNILVTEIDGQPVPKIIDFGIARALDVTLTDRTLFTEMHQLVGTPDYMSPEQASLENPSIDGRSDIYSLGVLIHEVVSGIHPISRKDPTPVSVLETLRRVREEETPRLSTHAPSLKGDLEWVVQKAMAKDPDQRYDSAGSLARELVRIIEHHPVIAGPPSKKYLISKFIQRHRTLVTAITIATAALVTGAIVSTVQYFRAAALATEVQANEVELRQTFRNADYQMALQLSERRRTAESIAYFCRALRTDPGHKASASCLLSILTHQQLSKENDPHISFPDSIRSCRYPITLGENTDGFAIGKLTETATDALIHFRFSTGEAIPYPLTSNREIKFFSLASTDGKLVLADNTHLEIRDASDLSSPLHQIDFKTPITQLNSAPNDGVIIVGDAAGHLKQIQPATGEVVSQIDSGDAAITALSIGRDGTLVGYGTAAGKVGVWGLRLGFQQDVVTAHSNKITSISMAASGVLLASGDQSGNVHLHRLPQLRHIAGPLYHSNEISALSISPSSQRLISGATDGYARIWNLRTHRLSVPARYFQKSITFLAPAYQPENIISSGTDGSVRNIDVRTGNGEALSRAGRSSSIAISPDRSKLLSLSNPTRTIRLLDLSRLNAQPQWLNEEGPTDFQTSEAKNSIRSKDGRTEVERISTKQLEVLIDNNLVGNIRSTHEIADFALRGDARMLATLHHDKLQLWDPATQEALSPIIHLTHPADAIRFPDRDGQIDLNSGEFGWMRLSVPPSIPHEMPEWFLDFAERIGGRQLDEKGILHTTKERDLRQATNLLPADLAGHTSLPDQYAQWLAADPKARPLGPGLKLSVADYVQQLVASKKRYLILEALRISPNHPEALRFLRNN